jgi:hypothetical protein
MSQGGNVKDSSAMILNLDNEYALKARDHVNGGILCSSSWGPYFGGSELRVNEPLLGEGKI